jgi:hypothetical protein
LSKINKCGKPGRGAKSLNLLAFAADRHSWPGRRIVAGGKGAALPSPRVNAGARAIRW